MQLQDKIAIITGASSGLGAEFSRRLIEKGAIVYGIARRVDRLHEIHADLGDRFIPVIMDLTDETTVRNWAKSTFSDGNVTPDILVNNAGLGHFGEIDQIPSQKWHEMVNINLNAVFYMTSSVVPYLKKNESVTHIINVASIAGKLGNARLSGYNATKFAIGGFSDALMKELREFGIKVTCLYPGSIATEFFKNSGSELHPNMMASNDVATVLLNVLEMPDNFLIDEVVMRPLFPKSVKL
jgi:short-subunit dehydrogenase